MSETGRVQTHEELARRFRTYRDFCLAAGDEDGDRKAAVWNDAAKIVEERVMPPAREPS